MTKNRKSRKTNDLLQLTVMVTILMSFAGYEAGQKEQTEPIQSSEFSKSSPLEDNQPDTLQLIKTTLHSNSRYFYEGK